MANNKEDKSKTKVTWTTSNKNYAALSRGFVPTKEYWSQKRQQKKKLDDELARLKKKREEEAKKKEQEEKLKPSYDQEPDLLEKKVKENPAKYPNLSKLTVTGQDGKEKSASLTEKVAELPKKKGSSWAEQTKHDQIKKMDTEKYLEQLNKAEKNRQNKKEILQKSAQNAVINSDKITKGRDSFNQAKRIINNKDYSTDKIVDQITELEHKQDSAYEKENQANKQIEALKGKKYNNPDNRERAGYIAADMDNDELENLKGLAGKTGDDNWDYFQKVLKRGKPVTGDPNQEEEYDRALQYVYQNVRKGDYTSDMDTIRRRGSEWYDLIKEMNKVGPIKQVVRDANHTGDDADELDVEIDGTMGRGVNSTLNVHLGKDQSGQFVFEWAKDSATGNVYGPDQLEELEAKMGYRKLDLNGEAYKTAMQGYQTDVQAAQTEARYYQDQLDKLEAEKRFIDKYNDFMNGYGETTMPEYIQEKDIGGTSYRPLGGLESQKEKDKVHLIYSFANQGKEFLMRNVGDSDQKLRMAAEYNYAMMMNDNELAHFNDYYNRGLYDEAMSFLDGLNATGMLRRRYSEEIEPYFLQQSAEQFPVLSSIAAQGMMAADTLISPAREIAGWFGNESVKDPYTQWYAPARQSSQIQNAVTEKIENEFGPTAARTYQSAMSSIRNVVNALMTRGFGLTGKASQMAASLGLFASQIYQESVYENLVKTNDYDKARGLAALDAAMETAEELLPYGTMLSSFGGRPILAIIANMLSEAGEEFTGASIGEKIKGMITGRDSVQQRADEIYMAGGYYQGDKWIELDKKDKQKALNEADMQAIREWRNSIVEQTIGGAMGGGFGAVYGGLNYAGQTFDQGRTLNREQFNGKSKIQSILDIAKKKGNNSQSFETASKIQQKIDEGKKPGNYQSGKLAQQVEQEAYETLNNPNATAEELTESINTLQSMADIVRGRKTTKTGPSVHLAGENEIRDAERNSQRVQGAKEVIYDGRFTQLDGVTIQKEKGKYQLGLNITVDGQRRTVPASELSVTDYVTAQIIDQAASNPEFYSEGYTNLLLKAQEDGRINQDELQNVLKEAKTARLLSYAGYTSDRMQNVNLDQDMKNEIWMQSVKEHGQNRRAQVETASRKKNARISYDDAEYGTDQWEEKTSGLDEETKNWMNTIAGIAQRAGIETTFRSLNDTTTYGWENNQGIGLNINGRNFERVDGKTVETGKHHMLVTFGHEMTHWLQRNSMQGYNRLEQYVLQSFINDKGADYVMSQIQSFMNSDGLSLEDAISEIVADSCDQILTNESVRNRIAQTDTKLFDQIKNFVSNLIDRFKTAVLGMEGSKSRYAVEMADRMNEISRLWLGAYDEALSKVTQGKETTSDEQTERQSHAGMDKETLRDLYISNFAPNTPASIKANKIISMIQNVWSKQPITLKIYDNNSNGRYIEAKFDPDYDPTNTKQTDAGKLAYGNFKGNRAERRAMMNLADDYPHILQHSKYVTFEAERKNHKDVKRWFYFTNDIYYADQGSDEAIPYRVEIDVKEKPDGNYVYTYFAREDKNAQRKKLSLMDLVPVNTGVKTDESAQASDKSITRGKENDNTRKSQADTDTRRQLQGQAARHIQTNQEARDLIYQKYGINENDIMFGIEFTDDGKVDYAAHDDAEKKLIRKISKADLKELYKLQKDTEKWRQTWDEDAELDTEDYWENAEEMDAAKADPFNQLIGGAKPIERYAAKVNRYGKYAAVDREAYADLDKRYEEAVKNKNWRTAEQMLMDKYQQMEKDGLTGYNAIFFHNGDHAEIARLIKTGDPQIIQQVAEAMALKVPDNAVLVPMPPHNGQVTDKTDTLILAKAIAEITNKPVAIALESDEHISRNKAKADNIRGVTADSMGFRKPQTVAYMRYVNGRWVQHEFNDFEFQENEMPIFIDNVVGGGVTAQAAHNAIGRGITLAYAQSSRSKVKGTKYLSVTYDENNNLIPLSQRMDPNNKSWKYSKANIDKTRDLIAYHNLTADQLIKVLQLGGFAMPSIGITKNTYVNDRYGEISVVFNKDTIDPQRSRLNKVFGGDAWTPTYPNVEYKINSKKLRTMMNRIDKLVPMDKQIDRVYLYEENLTKDLNSARGDAVQAVKRYDILKQAYLADKGIQIETPMREKRLGTGTKLDNNEIIRVAETLGEETTREAYNGGYEWLQQHPEVEQKIIDTLNEMKKQELMERVNDKEKADKMYNVLKIKKDDWGYGRTDSVLLAALNYFNKGVQQEVDEYAMKDKINAAIDEEDYEAWLKEQLDGIIEKKGIRNNKDYFTNQGNQRSWEALHDEETLENVVRVMKEQDDKGANTFFNQSAILALGTKDFRSIDDIRKNKGQLQHISDEEMSELKTDIVNRFGALADELTKDVKGGLFEQLEARDHVRSGIVYALRRTRTANGIQKAMKEWNYNLSDTQAQEIVDLMNEISNLPTEYFEAKPQRGVGLDEIAFVLVPEGTNEELLNRLTENGIEVDYYDGTTENRLEKMNQHEDVRFSRYTPENMDVQTWLNSASPSTFQTEDERALWQAYKDLRISMSLSLKKQLDYQNRIKQLEARENSIAEDGRQIVLSRDEKDELIALRNKLEIEKNKLSRLENEMFQITSGEGFAAMMYRNNIVLKDFIQGKTQDQVRQTVEDMLKLVQKTQEQIRKDTEDLKKLAESQAVKAMKSYLGKSSLGQVASRLRKAYNSAMGKAEIEDRVAEMALKQASGQDITADTEALAQDLLDRMRGIRSENLEYLRGTTLVISRNLADEMKAENTTLKELRSQLKGSGVTLKVEDKANFRGQWTELRENNGALPDPDEHLSESDLLHSVLDFIQGEVDSSRGANQNQYDFDEVALVVKANVGNVTTYLANDPAARAQINSLMKQIAELSKKTEKTAEQMEAIDKQLDEVVLAGQKAKGWTTVLQRDVNDAIRYYNKTAEVAAQVEKTKVRKQLIETLRNEHTKKLIEQQEKFNERLKKDKRTRELVEENKVLRRKISTVSSRMANRIFAETDQKNVPEEAKPLVRSVLKMIAGHDDLFRRVTFDNKKQITDVMLRLAKMDQVYGEFDPSTDLDWLIVGKGEDADTEIRDKVWQMLVDIESGLLEYRNAEGNGSVTLQDRRNALSKVQEAVSDIWSIVQARSEAEIQGRKWQVYELAELMEEDAEKSTFKGERIGTGRKARESVTGAINYGNLTPEYFFKRLKNRAMEILHSGLKEAENRRGLELAKAKARMAQIAKEQGLETWDGQEKHQVKVAGGRTIEMTTEQIMALYATWLREGNQLRPEETAHLLHGGFVLSENEKAGKPGREKKSQRPIMMTEDQLENLSSYLTDQQKAYVDDVVAYMSGELAELGNEASMKMYGIKKFTEQYYFPIKSWGGVLNSRSDAGVRNNNENRAAQQGFSKRIRANANNAIEIADFTPTAMKHIAGMINYNTVGPAIENMNKVLNQQLEYGIKTEEEDDTYKRTYKRNMRASFQENYGKQAYEYLVQFMEDLNGGMARRQEVLLRDKLLSLFKKNAVAGSLSVAAQQPLSYIRAAMMINPKYLAEALNPKYWKGSYAEMMKHSGLAVIKDMGKFDMNYGRTAEEYLMPDTKESKGRKAWNKLNEVITSGPKMMDDATWTRMWTAVKLEQMALNKGMDYSSDEFMNKVAERFNDLMRRTQVYDSVMVKSANMRSNNYLKKVATSFMAEPTLSLNVLEDAWNSRHEKGGKAMVAKALATFMLSAAAQAGAKAFFGTGRSPDKKKNREENFLNKFGYNLLSEGNPLGLIPGFSQLIDVLTDGELKDDAMGMIGKATEVYDNIFKIATGDKSVNYRNLEDTVGQLVQLFTNVPLKNLMRDFRAMVNFFSNGAAVDFTGDTYAQRPTSGAVLKYQFLDTLMSNGIMGALNKRLADAGYGISTTDYYKRIYNAEKAGNKQASDGMKEYLMLGKGVTEENINSKVKTVAKNDDSLSAAERTSWMIKEGMMDEQKEVTSQYRDGKLSRQETIKLMKQMDPEITDDEIWWKLDQIDYKKETGAETVSGYYYRLKDAVNANKAEKIQSAVKQLLDHGITKEKIKDKLSDWKSDYMAADSAGKVRIRDAITKAYKAAGYKKEDADKTIEGWMKEKKKKDGSSSILDRALRTSASANVISDVGNGKRDSNDTTGRYGRGNIDLNNRKVYTHPDGEISTEISMSFYDEDTGKEVLIPTVIDGKIVSDMEAINHYYRTGEYLGMFDTPEEADEYAQMLHERQDWYYHR